MDLLFVKPFETIFDTSPLKPWHNSRPVATKALDDVGRCFAVFLGIEDVFDLLLKESLLLRADTSLYVVLG